jgi:hypothetical protein
MDEDRRMPDPLPQLARDQRRVLQAVYDRFRELCAWPTFGDLDRQFARGRNRLDAGRELERIPSLFVIPLGTAAAFAPDVPVKLHLEGVALCSNSGDDLDLLFHALRWMAVRQSKPDPAASTSAPTVSAEQFRSSVKIAKSRMCGVQRVGAILAVEQWGWLSGGCNPDGNWTFTLSRDVRRFARVRSLEDYRAVQQDWNDDRLPVATSQFPGAVSKNVVPPAVTAVADYVRSAIVEEIEAKAAVSAWRCDKLLHLVHELNDNYARGNAYAAHGLLRSILDHIPPLFGYGDFAHVANNHPWSTSDKRYMKKLLDFKLQGDDALHRQISRKDRGLLSVDDLPPRPQVNRLLEECAAQL